MKPLSEEQLNLIRKIEKLVCKFNCLTYSDIIISKHFEDKYKPVCFRCSGDSLTFEAEPENEPIIVSKPAAGSVDI